MSETLYASFNDYKMAEKAVGALLDHGMNKDQISLIAQNHDHANHEAHAEHGITTTTGADAASGAAKGAGVGLAVGALGALASLLIPGFGLVLGGGALATALGAAAGTTAAGAVAGGMTGFLQDQGIEESAARDYAETVERGGALVELRLPSGDMDMMQAEQILNKYNAMNIRRGGMATGGTGDTMQANTAMGSTHTQQNLGTLNERSSDLVGKQAIPVVEEELMVGKREVEKGVTRVEKVITERPVQEQINLREEHVTVERHPVNRAATSADIDAFQEGTIELHEKAEEAVIGKQARVVEEVVVGTEVTNRTETINDTVRRTDVKVSDFHNDFQSDYNTRFTGTQFQGKSYNDFEPAYHYGYELGNDSRFQNSDWNTVETSARSDWANRGHNHKWEDVKDAVRFGYDRVRGGIHSRY
jgi:uncharacterized protein (TIGR02271 family)